MTTRQTTSSERPVLASGRDRSSVSEPERWLAEHGDALFAYARSRGVAPDDAEDLVQDTLLIAFERRETFEERSTLRTWLIGILRLKLLERHRRRRAEPERMIPDLSEGFFTDGGKWRPKHPAVWDREAGELLASDDFRRVLRSCLGRLPDRVAETFLLAEAHGLDTASLSRALDATPNHVHVMLYRARVALRRCLECRLFRKERP